MILDLLLLILILMIITFLGVVSIYHFTILFTWPPSIPTEYNTREVMSDLINKYKINDKCKIVDIGSGFGNLVFHVSKKNPHASIYGYEIFWFSYIISKILLKLYQYSNVILIYDNFKNANFENVEIVLCYLTEDINRKITSFLQKNLKKGTILISNSSTFPSFNLIEEIKHTSYGSIRFVYVYKM